MLAKSTGETLADHTLNVVRMVVANGGNSTAIKTALLHDAGKVARDFQSLLHGKAAGEWSKVGHRHEILSLAFVDAFFPASDQDRLPIALMVAFHHKNLDDIVRLYGGNGGAQNRQALLANLSAEDAQHFIDWCEQVAATLGITMKATKPVGDFSALLTECLRYIQSGTHVADLHSRGLIISADRGASAGLGTVRPFQMSLETATRSLGAYALRAHQEAAKTAIGNTIAIVPTGGGKSELANLWATVNSENARHLFYMLPYQASMNAMYERLAVRNLGYGVADVRLGRCPDVAIMHGNAIAKMYLDYMSEDASPDKAMQTARSSRNRQQLFDYPIVVSSPYQLLKATFGVRGHEVVTFHLSNSLFVIDEIHTYEAKRLAMFVESMRWMHQHLGARFCVMTATLNSLLRERLVEALAIKNFIQADKAEYERSRRHMVKILPGDLAADVVPRVVGDVQAGRHVLVCVNLVRRARDLYATLKETLGDCEVILLHSSFAARDRAAYESKLLDLVGVGRKGAKPVVCVATQVVEVSLDVDFDVLYTDPAPIEAILQRAGRINRGRTDRTLCDVFIYTDRPQYDIYNAELVAASMRELADLHEQPIDEATVTAMIDRVYSGKVGDAWVKAYERAQEEFCSFVLGEVKAYQVDEEAQRSFDRLFDGCAVLPVQFLSEYDRLLEEKLYIEAGALCLNLPYGRVQRLLDKGLARKRDDLYIVEVDYSHELGLLI